MLTRWVTTYVSVGYSTAVRTTNGRTCTKEYSWGCWNCRRCRWDYFNCLPCVTEVWKYSKLSLTCNIWIRRESKTLFRLKLSEEIDAARILVYSSCISVCGSVLLSVFEKNTYSLSLSLSISLSLCLDVRSVSTCQLCAYVSLGLVSRRRISWWAGSTAK